VPKLDAGLVTRFFSLPELGRSAVLVDHACEESMASDRGIERDHGGWVVVGWGLVEAVVRPVVGEVLSELVLQS
jgi:hypothetical protein